ncbi:MAG: family 1 glycosylhydrolase, partial [bacterium]|nr:family 1 glycosylhydrolase [bacterium]
MKNFIKFPKGFFWGAASSSYQTEGGNFNDWTLGEKENCERLAKETGKSPENFINGLACDHYHRYCEDFDLGKTLGLNACRISLEWSRIEPEEGKFDEKELAHYKEVIAAMKERN